MKKSTYSRPVYASKHIFPKKWNLRLRRMLTQHGHSMGRIVSMSMTGIIILTPCNGFDRLERIPATKQGLMDWLGY